MARCYRRSFPAARSAWRSTLLALVVAACSAPEEDPPPVDSGLPMPQAGVYTDAGLAPLDAKLRALVALPLRDAAGLAATLAALYDPASPRYRRYLTAAEWNTLHAPTPDDAQRVTTWLASTGLRVDRVAANRLLVEVTGTVAQFNALFDTKLHSLLRDHQAPGVDDIPVFSAVEPLRAPRDIRPLLAAVVSADEPALDKPLSAEAGDVETELPPNPHEAITPANVASAYEVDPLIAAGRTGAGVRLGVVVGAGFKFKDLQSFWQTFGITRADPKLVVTMEPIATRFSETTLDVEWAGALAPGADLIVYAGPDARNTSIVYTFNEAIARGEVDVISSSFAHREDAEPRAVHEQFDRSAQMAAALGITVAVSSGDSAAPDVPSSSPYITAVGGTQLELTPEGVFAREIAWVNSGSGLSRTFAAPSWQLGLPVDLQGKRAVSDVSLNASPITPFWRYYLGKWSRAGGTSFSAPIFASLMALVDEHRAAKGLPRVGCLNPALYRTPAVQAAFRDIVEGSTATRKAGPGWDYPTGFGAPRTATLADAIP